MVKYIHRIAAIKAKGRPRVIVEKYGSPEKQYGDFEKSKAIGRDALDRIL
jgi:hypothetical protein